MLSPAAEVRPAGARVIEPFDYRGVSLNDGPLLLQVLEVRDFKDQDSLNINIFTPAAVN